MEQDLSYDVFIFELDNVIFPRRDYVLQVYYLFAAFVEYTELQPSAQTLTQTFKEVYEAEGEEDIFSKIAPVFNISPKYEERLQQLYHTARLPQKLWMYQKTFELMQKAFDADKKIWIVTDGLIEEQINKIRQIEWNGLQNHIQIFFTQEHAEHNKALMLEELLEREKITVEQALLIYDKESDGYLAKAIGVVSKHRTEL